MKRRSFLKVGLVSLLLAESPTFLECAGQPKLSSIVNPGYEYDELHRLIHKPLVDKEGLYKLPEEKILEKISGYKVMKIREFADGFVSEKLDSDFNEKEDTLVIYRLLQSPEGKSDKRLVAVGDADGFGNITPWWRDPDWKKYLIVK